MFDKILRELKRLENGVRISVKIPLDDEGYFDRVCPAESCQSDFKVLFKDWREKVTDERVFCPICRNEAPAGDWNTDEQAEYIKNHGFTHVQDVIHNALAEGAESFNRAQRPGFIQVSMSAKRGTRPTIIPIEAAKAMRQKFICEVCGCHYASIGVAFFCPACGHNSAIATFSQTVEIIRQVVSMSSSIRGTLAISYDEDIAQNSVRNMLEDNLGRIVGAFQHLAEALFDQLPNATDFKRRKNVFQNLGESSLIWRNAVGKGYENMLSLAELREMENIFQKRHLIAHRNGIVDQEYIDKSGDNSLAVGQRLVIQESTVIRLIELLSKLSGELRKVV